MNLPFLDPSLTTGQVVFLIAALTIALGFEFVNGFHDTANAVATVIYTRSMSPRAAVLWSGLWNFLGVYGGGIAVAYSIVYLLPVDLLISIGSGAGMAMVLALLSAAILWNLGTWYVGIPASSSHALIGSILGVGLATSALNGQPFGSGINWHKAEEVGLSLFLSPVLGFGAAAVLLYLVRKLLPQPVLHDPAPKDGTPPWPVRIVLWVTCTGVSFAHGSNDGQKGIGLIMLILIGILPTQYALNLDAPLSDLQEAREAIDVLEAWLDVPGNDRNGIAALSKASPKTAVEEKPGWVEPLAPRPLREHLLDMRRILTGLESLRDLPPESRWQLRTDVLEIEHTLRLMIEARAADLPANEKLKLQAGLSQLRDLTDYAPTWVLMAVACALGIGTTVGWKRIVVTVGEKIGKTHMSYAQGACAETVAMTSIGLAGFYGLPVSTTQVLSSGVAGTMAVSGSGVQAKTIRNILMAWFLTLPTCLALSSGLFLVFRGWAP